MTNHLFEFTCIQLGVADNVTHCPTAAVDVQGLFCGASLTHDKSEKAADLCIMVTTIGNTFCHTIVDTL